MSIKSTKTSHNSSKKLSKQEIVRSKILLQKIFSKTATKLYTQHLKCFVIKEDKTEHSRFFVSVSKKNVKLAVTRNQIKRRLKEAIRLEKQTLSNVLNIAIVYAHKQPLPYQVLLNEIRTVFEKINAQNA